MSFIFICVDKSAVRRMLTDYLVKKGICFIDTGLGVNLVDDKLIGTLRITGKVLFRFFNNVDERRLFKSI